MDIKRSDFPKNFIFGAGTSAYQVEGAWNVDGKGRSNWDNFAIHTPGSIADGTNGCTAANHYNKFKDDVALIKKVGLDAYRFSIAWSRILPAGKLSGGVSREGIKYYNDLIDALLAEGIEPWATLFHWDLPQCLEDEYGGFLNKQIVYDFSDYAEVCFWEFGDRVKHWTTLNEPWSYTYMGYVSGFFPPGRGGFFAPLVEQAKDEAKREGAANKKEHYATKKSRKHDSSEDSSVYDSEEDSSDSDSDDGLDWLPFFGRIINLLMDPDKCLKNLPMQTQQLTHRSPIGDCFEFEDKEEEEEDSDKEEEEDSDTEEEETDEGTYEEDSDMEDFVDALASNLIGYTLLEKDLAKNKSASNSACHSLKTYLGLMDKPTVKRERDQPAVIAIATATATEQTKQPVSAAEQKKSVEKKAPCLKGDPGTEPYIVAHNLILSHAYAVQIYRTKYQKHQEGQIGITNVAVWYYPLNDTKEDEDAVSRALDFQLGWFVAPVVIGDYPASMRNIVRRRLPKFTSDEVKVVKGSYDFLGINYYTTHYATTKLKDPKLRPHYDNDALYEHKYERNGKPIGEKGGSSWLYIVPEGIYHLMLYMKERYNDPVMYITENGLDERNIKTNTISKIRNDEKRVKYHKSHLEWLKKAMKDGVCLKGYFIWSLLDNFEWAQGYNARFGIFYVDFVNGRLTRFPKSSAKWWMNFLKKPKIPRNALAYNPETLKKLLTEKTKETTCLTEEVKS